MKVPSEIPIFGRNYSLEFVDQATDDKEQNTDATIEFYNSTIEITESIDQKKLLSTILHECFHGVIHRVGINQANLSNDLEEIIVENFSTFITETFDLKFKKDLF